MFQLPDISGQVTVDINPLKQRFGEAQREARSFASRFNGAMGSMGAGIANVAGQVASLATRFASIGIGAGAAGLAGLATWSVKLAADAEQTRVAFTTMLGSAERAKALIADINKFAAATPFEPPELQEATKRLLAFGVAHEQAIPTMRMLGDVAAGLNIPLTELAAIYGKVKTGGLIQAEELEILSGRGIPVYKEFAKQLGVSESAVKKMASEGKISFANLQQALVSMTSAGGMFAGGMAAQSKTLAGVFSTLKGDVEQSLTRVGESITENLDLREVTSGASQFAQAMTMTALPAIESFLGSLSAGGDVGERFGRMMVDATEWAATGLAHIHDKAHLVIAGFKALQLGGVMAFKAIVDGGILSNKALASTINLFSEFTGVTIESNGILESLSSGLAEDAAKLKKEMSDAFAVFDEGEGPKKVRSFFIDVRREMEAGFASVQAAARLDTLGQISPTLGFTGSIVAGGGGADAFKKMLGDGPQLSIDTSGVGAMSAEMKQLQKDVEQFREGLKGPVEQYDEAIARLRQWRDEQRITGEEFTKGVAQAKAELESNAPKKKAFNADDGLAAFVRAGSADAVRMSFKAELSAQQGGSKDEIPKRHLGVAERQETLLREISERLNFEEG